MTGHSRSALAAIIFFSGSAVAPGAQQHNWSGCHFGSPLCDNPNPAWGDSNNWLEGAPHAGPNIADDLVFANTARQASTINTFTAGTRFRSITISAPHQFFGNAITLHAGISASVGAIIQLPIALNARQTFNVSTAGATLVFQGATITTNDNILDVDGAGNIVIISPLSGGNSLIKEGTGTLQFVGNQPYTGLIQAEEGTVRISGTHSGGIFVDGGRFEGAGTVQGIRSFEGFPTFVVAPGGTSPNETAIINSVGDLTFRGPGTFAVDLKGTTAGSGYDQLNVTGTVSILSTVQRAALTVNLVNFTPSPGDSFVIVNNDGTDPVQGGLGGPGEFLNRAEGSSFSVSGTTFFITYLGGDGNDIVLHVPTTRTWDGGGANNNWMTAANWVGDVAPAVGDDLVFPPGAARRSNTNNFPAGTKFNSISIDGGYILGGNAIVLQAGITSTGNSSNSVNLGEIKLDANQGFTKSGQGGLLVSANIDTNGKALTLLSATSAGTHTYRGIISGTGGINMAALNTAIIEGSQINTFTGPTVISSGLLIVHSRLPGSPVQITGGRLLGRSGELGSLTATGGTIFPFFGGPTTLGVSGNLNLNSAATLEISFADDSNGAAFGSKLEVAGAVDLGGSTLLLDSFFAAPQTGDQVTIIDNDGTDPVVGTFGSLPEGASFAFGNATVQISYQGGDGNDVVLHVTAVAPVGIGLVKLTNGTDNDAPPGPALPVGSTVTFHYLVTNTASTPLEGVSVKDDNGTPGIPGDDLTATLSGGDTNSNNRLDPGETFTYTASRIATEGQHTNIGEARGSGVPFGPIVTASNADNHFGGTPPASRLANISTRLRVQAGDNALIGGFIVTGTQDKRVMLRAIGPSLAQFFSDPLANPKLELFQGDTLLQSNDDWKDTQRGEIEATTIPPANDLESAIVTTLPANNNGYTAVVSGVSNSTGFALVEVYDLDRSADSKLANISTRGFVQTGDNVLIAGTIVTGSASQKVIIRALGPSLQLGGRLEDPTLELRDQNGALLQDNDNWMDSPNKQAIIDSTIPPSNDLESAIVATLPASNASYTAIVRGVDDSTGIALIEVYAVQ